MPKLSMAPGGTNRGAPGAGKCIRKIRVGHHGSIHVCFAVASFANGHLCLTASPLFWFTELQ
jgi:hypothetical protein